MTLNLNTESAIVLEVNVKDHLAASYYKLDETDAQGSEVTCP